MSEITTRYTSGVTQVEDLSDQFVKCEPMLYPTATLVHINQGAPPTESTHRWGETAVKAQYTQVNDGTGIDTTTTTIDVDSTTGMVAGCKLRNTRTGEIIICGTVASGTQLTGCTRGAYGAAGCTTGTGIAILDNDVIEIMNTSLTEGFAYSTPTVVANNPDQIYNLLSLEAYAIDISGTQKALEARGDKAFNYGYEDDYAEALTLLKRDINKSFLTGSRYSNGLTYGSKLTVAGGLPYYAYHTSTKVGDLSDRTTFENLMKPIAEYSPGEYLCPASWITMQSIQRLYQGENIGNFNGDILKIAGIEIRKITHPMGTTFNFYYDPTLIDYYYETGSAWRGQFQVYSPKYAKIHYNRPVGRYTVPPTGDSNKEVVMAEWTFSFKGARRFGAYMGVTPVS